MEIQFREANEADERGISRLLGVLGYPAQVAHLGKRLSLAEIDPEQVVVIAELEGEVVAFASLVFVPFFHLGRKLCRVSALAVDAAHQGKGVGRKLMEEVERIAREQNCPGIELTSSHNRPGAHRFYERLGYAQTSLKFRKRLE